MKTVIEMARRAGAHDDGFEVRFLEPRYLERFAAFVAAYEREECAKVCEAGVVQTNNWDASDYNKSCEIRAAAIRNRGER
jgi:hypothetical protein